MYRGLMLLWLALGSTGCGSEPKVATCAANSDCAVGEACVDGTCAPIECYTNETCVRGSVCNAAYQCVPGCDSDLDCDAGEQCSDGSCVAYECRTTQSDCAYDEVCEGGSCVDHGGGACDRCDPGTDDYCFPLYEEGPCGADSECPRGERCYVADYERDAICSSDADCGVGYACKTITFSDGSTSGPHCTRNACFAGAIYPPCTPSEGNTCGRGFQCFDLGSDVGVCFADCEWLTESGHL